MLVDAIHQAANAIDARNMAQLRRRTIDALDAAAIAHNTATARLQVSPGTDYRIWFSFKIDMSGSPGADYRDKAEQVVEARSRAGLRLVSPTYPDDLDVRGGPRRRSRP